MIDARVLITTYAAAFLHRGGGEAELIDLAENLRQLGLRVDIYGPSSQPLSKYDSVLHFSVHGGGLDLLREVKHSSKKIVLLPNVWWTQPPAGGDKRQVEEFFSLADQIVFKSKAERDNVAQFVTPPSQKTSFYPWGVDPSYGHPADPKLFKQTHGIEDYVLWIGIIEERKNQLTAIHALGDVGIPVVFIGDYRDRSYYEACVRSAPRNFKFIPHIPARSELLRSALQNCRVYLEASLEPPGFSALEAGLSGRPMVLSEGPWSSELFGDSVIQVDPRSAQSIRAGVEAAMKQTAATGPAQRMRNGHVLPTCLEPLVRLLQSRPAARQERTG